ncbi:DUF427 domain-containing protein [Mycobacterium sp. PS03-16]|uniref:DUF427 domain-containing protein n=1 Tax=Mycobacterium sp. PS03-16 TaxID=2559611 RepID=UPI0010749574|nr:DUF427 domain-containing protein [Mycobacterium sp. PS03-16]TFV55932.1 DUF427 domain-containing protein [Mycobacterium sp. PS03-16]
MAGRPRPEPARPGQESVWDYPRPPRLEEFRGSITVEFGGRTVASTTRGWRVLETSHPPTYYLPADTFAPGTLRPAEGGSWCEWKGRAAYFDVVVHDGVVGDRVAPKAAWTYPQPTRGFEAIAGAVAVMAAQMDRCTVNGEQVLPQPGGFYGGWITSRVVGPFKGVPGSMGW